MPNASHPLVGVIMGSESDWEPVMQYASATLKKFGISHENGVYSIHRTAERLREYVLSLRQRGLKVLIAGAGGGAAHLPGTAKAFAPPGFPVIGVPVDEKSLVSVVDMPSGAPVLTMAPGKKGAENAAIAAAEILGVTDPRILQALEEHYRELIRDVVASHERLQTL